MVFKRTCGGVPDAVLGSLDEGSPFNDLLVDVLSLGRFTRSLTKSTISHVLHFDFQLTRSAVMPAGCRGTYRS